MVVIVVGAFVRDEARVSLWIAGITVFLIGTIRAGTDDWIIRTGHFAERHGLIIIIALGEVIVALGNSIVVSEGRVAPSTVVTLVTAGVLASLLWWSYFDRVQPAFEHRAEVLTGVARGRFVRDIYTYAHVPLVAGIVLTAVALEYMTLHPTDTLPATFRTIGAAGLVMFFGGIGIGVYRSFRVIAKERVVAVTIIVALMAFGGSLDGVVLFVAIDIVLLVALATEHLRIEGPVATVESPSAPASASATPSN
jgi:low temperature requirement protein LtrA